MSQTVLDEDENRLGSRSMIGLLLTQLFGAFNDNMFRWLAVPIAQQELGQAWAIAIGTVCLTIPFLVFSPAGGWLADRYSKRNVILGCKIAEIVIMLLGVLSILYGNVYALFAVVVLMGAQSALFGPAKFGAIPEYLPTKLLSKGNGYMGMISIIAVGLGTIAGFAVYDATKPQLGAGDWSTVWPSALFVLGVAVAGTLTSLMLRKVPAADPQRQPALNPLWDAIPAVRSLTSDVRLIRTSLGIAFFYFLASLAQQNIDPFGETILSLSKTDIGILFGILIAGVGAGSILAGVWSEGKVELGIVPFGAIGLIFSSFLVYWAGSSVDLSAIEGETVINVKSQFAYWGSCLGLFLLGASAGLFDVPLEAYLQFRADPKQRGMVLAGNYFVCYVLIVASSGVFLLLRSGLGLSANTIFLISGLITIPVAFYILKLVPDLTFRFFMWLVTHTLYRVRVYGRENIPDHGSGLIVPNHVSFVDGIIMMITTSRRVRFIIYQDFCELWYLKKLGEIMRVIPINASGPPRDIVKAIRTAKDALKDGELVCIFAEGGLTRTGQVQPFQRGMMKILQGTGAPVYPTYLHGLWGSIFSHRGGKMLSKWPSRWRHPIDVHFGEAMHDVTDPADVRHAVEKLGAEAAQMDAARHPIPARRFIHHCKKAKNKTKIVDSTKTELTGGKLLTAALAMRRVLKRSVFQAGEQNVGLLVPPSVGGALANMAVALCGKTGVNLNYTLSEDVFNYCIKKAGLKHVITSKKFLEKKPYNLDDGCEFVFLEDLKEQIGTMDKLLSAAAAYAVPASILERSLGLTKIDSSDPLTIVFTSGSTGEPKGVVLSHCNVGSNIEAVDHLLNLSDKDALVGVLPFFHSFGYTACMWLPMCYNVRGVYHFNPLDAKIVGRLTRENKATILMATPTFLKMYLRRCEKEDFETLDLIVVGAEKLQTELAKEFEAKFGVLPTEGYGTTELSPVAAVNIPDHRAHDIVQQGTKLGTVGRPLPGVTAKVVNPDTGEDLGLNTEGLLMIKGPNVMCGYLDQPEKTAEVIHDGWYNTGDFASLDSDGFVTITGRQSRFSKIGGEMVPHIKIEEELTKICEEVNTADDDKPGEVTLAVTAVPCPKKGERIIVLHRELCKPIDQVIKELAATGIPKLWIPAANSFLQVEEIPILGTGKLDLKGVKETAMNAFAEEAAAT